MGLTNGLSIRCTCYIDRGHYGTDTDALQHQRWVTQTVPTWAEIAVDKAARSRAIRSNLELPLLRSDIIKRDCRFTKRTS